MPRKIIASPEGIAALYDEAQRAYFAAEDADQEDDYAKGVYETLQYLHGDGERPELEES
jgi:hypothetical protein